jgi:hypothetical protein
MTFEMSEVYAVHELCGRLPDGQLKCHLAAAAFVTGPGAVLALCVTTLTLRVMTIDCCATVAERSKDDDPAGVDEV